MFCIVYLYAVCGVAFFGGYVTLDSESPHYQKLSKMAYGQSGYWIINFNDMPSGMVLMVQLLVVNNWMVFTEAYVAVAGASAWFLFITFYGVGVIAGESIVVPISKSSSCDRHEFRMLSLEFVVVRLTSYHVEAGWIVLMIERDWNSLTVRVL
jgi:hypothetical protein